MYVCPSGQSDSFCLDSFTDHCNGVLCDSMDTVARARGTVLRIWNRCKGRGGCTAGDLLGTILHDQAAHFRARFMLRVPVRTTLRPRRLRLTTRNYGFDFGHVHALPKHPAWLRVTCELMTASAELRVAARHRREGLCFGLGGAPR